MINALDFINELADKLSWPQIDTLSEPQPRSKQRKMLRTTNTVLRATGAYNDWPILRAEGSIVTVASILTDADSSEFVTATEDSDTITVAGQSFDDTFIGRDIQVSGDDTIYRIIDTVSPTQLQLDRAWVAASITVADERVACIAMDRYALAEDFSRPINDAHNFFAPWKIKAVPPNEFEDRRVRDRALLDDDPDIFTTYGLNAAETAQIIHLHPWPKEKRLLRYQYQKLHPEVNSDNDKILYPWSYKDALLDICYQLCLRDYEDSAKMQQALVDMVRKHNLQQANPGITDSRPVIEPSGEVRRSVYASYGLPGRHVDWGDFFDIGGTFGYW
jgi:hypothetical protein